MTIVTIPRSTSVSAKVVSPSDFEKYFRDFLDEYVITGIGLTDGGSLNVTVAVGECRINGIHVEITVAESKSLSASSTNHIYIQLSRDSSSEVQSASIVSNTTGTAPTDSIKLGTVTTGASSISSIDTSSASGRQISSGVKNSDVTTIVDANSNEIIKTSYVTSAVNEITVKNAATGNPPEVQVTGNDTNIDLKLVPKGTGKIYGHRETFAYPMTDESTLPTTGVKYVTDPWPYDFKIIDVIAGLTTAGTGAALWRVDILKEDSVNANTFTTIFTTKPTIDASEFTSTTAATAMVLNVTTIEKGKRLQLKIDQLDTNTNTLARGAKVSIIGYATAS